MDDADFAGPRIEAEKDRAVLLVRSNIPRGPAATHCVDCGDDIPDKRREKVEVVRTCVSCQSLRERS